MKKFSKLINESDEVNISNERVDEISIEMEEFISSLEDNVKKIELYLNEFENYKSLNIKSNNQLDDSISRFQIVRNKLKDSLTELHSIIENIDDYKDNGYENKYTF